MTFVVFVGVDPDVGYLRLGEVHDPAQDVVDRTVACDAVDGSVRGVCLPGACSITA